MYIPFKHMPGKLRLYCLPFFLTNMTLVDGDTYLIESNMGHLLDGAINETYGTT